MWGGLGIKSIHQNYGYWMSAVGLEQRWMEDGREGWWMQFHVQILFERPDTAFLKSLCCHLQDVLCYCLYRYLGGNAWPPEALAFHPHADMRRAHLQYVHFGNALLSVQSQWAGSASKKNISFIPERCRTSGVTVLTPCFTRRKGGHLLNKYWTHKVIFSQHVYDALTDWNNGCEERLIM